MAECIVCGEYTKFNGGKCFSCYKKKDKSDDVAVAEPPKKKEVKAKSATKSKSSSEVKNIDIQSYRAEINTPYLLLSLVYMLSDVIVWFHKYSLENDNAAINKSAWQNIDFDTDGNKWGRGEIIKIAGNGWGTVQLDNPINVVSIYSELIEEGGFITGEKIQVPYDSTKSKKNRKSLK